jgi:type VI secretion system protein ImpC
MADNILEEIVDQGHLARSDDQKDYAMGLIGEFSNRVLTDEDLSQKDVATLISDQIAALDDLISSQLDEILHHEEFQVMEGSWRGLQHLVMKTETSTRLKIRLLPATRAELQKDLDKAVEFDQSHLFKKIYEEEYGTYGGMPYSLLIGDFYIGRSPMDIGFMEKIAGVAAAAHAPFLAAAAPDLFDLSSFAELGKPRDLAKVFESTELIKWRSFRETEDSRYVTLTLPRTLMRLPYGPETNPVEEFAYSENVSGKDHSEYLWGNPAYVLGERITNAFALHGWTAAIRGVEGGGIVEGLPAHTFMTDEGDIALKCPTEIAITDRREKELNDLGFLSLVHCKGTDKAAFFGGHTVNKPKVYNLDSANANASLSAMLPYILSASRFAHYFKVMMRDKIGSFMTAQEVQVFLQTWMSDYILLNDTANQNLKAKFPLREGRVDVMEVAGKPGVYTATAFLRPHFQLEELSASIRLVAELPPPQA